MTQYELNFNDYWRIIKKKRLVVFLTTIILTVFSLIFSILNKPTPVYQTSASLQIERSTSLTGLYMQSISWNYGDDLATRAAVIKSYSMIEKAAKDLGIIDSNMTSSEIKKDQTSVNAIERLKSRVTTEQEGFTNIININVRDYDPILTRDLANSLARIYQQENFKQKNEQIQNSLQSLKLQLDNAEQEYRNDLLRLQEYRKIHRFITIPEKSNRISTKLSENEENLERLKSDIKQIDKILLRLKNNPDYLRYISLDLILNHQNVVLNGLQSKIDRIENQIIEVSQYFTNEHPNVKSLKFQKKQTLNNLNAELKAFKNSLQELRIKDQEKWNSLNSDYESLPLQSIEVQNLEQEVETSRNIYQQLKINYLQSIVKQSDIIQEVFIIRPAFTPSSPINSTKIAPTSLAGMIIGMIFGIILAFIAETFDTTFRTIDDIEETLGTSVKGIIPFIDINDIKESLKIDDEEEVSLETLKLRSRLIAHYSPKTTIAESYRGLRTNINFSLMEKGFKTIMITSSVAGEGKTTVSMNLAISMAQTGMRTLLVETDLRKPRVSSVLGIDREPGLTDYIFRRASLDNCIKGMSDIMMGTLGEDSIHGESIPGIEYLSILTAGKIEKNPSEIIAGKKITDLIAQLKEEYDIIIFDSAPIMQATDSIVLGSKVDACLITYFQGKISRNTLRRAKNQMEMVKSNVLGVIINGLKANLSADYIDLKYQYEYLYSYGGDNTSQTETIFDKIKHFFVKPYNIDNSNIFLRLKKLKIFILLCIIVLLTFGTIFLTSNWNNIFSLKETPTTENQSVESNIIKDTTEIVNVTTDPDVSDKLKQYREELNIQNQKSETDLNNNETVNEKQNYLETEELSSKTPIGLSTPYTIQIQKTNSIELAGDQVRSIRNKGLDAFVTISYEDPTMKTYLVCHGNFTTKISADNTIIKLAIMGIDGDFVPLYIPYSIYLGDDEKYKNDIFSYPKYFESINQKSFLAGGFKTEETSNLFRKSVKAFRNKQILKR